jgi:hypothetical protein
MAIQTTPLHCDHWYANPVGEFDQVPLLVTTTGLIALGVDRVVVGCAVAAGALLPIGGVISPTLLPPTNHMSPPGPEVVESAWSPLGTQYCENTPAVLTRRISELFPGATHNAPSGPALICDSVNVSEIGAVKAVTVPLVVTLATSVSPANVTHSFPSVRWRSRRRRRAAGTA